MKEIDTVVIGAGVIGLACALRLAKAGHEVLVLETAGAIGTGVSSRNSEVIHAGIYYPQDSLKARLCVKGNQMLRDYAQARGVPFRMTGKLIVANGAAEERALEELQQKALANGVENIRLISGAEAQKMEPEVVCSAALYSPSSGIIDTHGLMLALQGEAEAHGATIAFHAPVTGGEITGAGIQLLAGEYELLARQVVIAAGLSSPKLARVLGLENVPQDYLCKGSYFALSGKPPFSRLVYPLPSEAGLGVHYTLDMGGAGKFGPDTEWIQTENYDVAEARREVFAASIKRYWPACTPERLQPSYAGIRPKIVPESAPAGDFRIDIQNNIAALYGIESPGLTSCLALADLVYESLHE